MARTIKKWLALVFMTATLVVCGVFMSACGKVGSVDVETLLFNGTEITWEEVKNAQAYAVAVDGKIYDVKEAKCSIPAKWSTESVEISVTPIGKKGKEGETTTRTFYRLETIDKDDISFSEEGVMSWEEVDGANEYIISLNKTEIKVTGTEFDQFVYGKKNDIKIRPNMADGSTFSKWSDKVSKMYYGAPTNIKYDGTTLTWTGASQSSSGELRGFAIYIDGYWNEEVVTGGSYVYNAEESDFTVEIKTLGQDIADGPSFSSPLSEAKEFVYLERLDSGNPDDVWYDEETGMFNWREVEGAKSYLVKLKEGSTPQELKQTQIKLSAGEQHAVSIMAVSEKESYFSMYSDPKDVYILKAPQPQWFGATFEQGIEEKAVYWQPVNGATGYKVNIKQYDITSGALVKEEPIPDLDGLAQDFGYAFAEVGKYELTVQALTTETDRYPSAPSNKYTITRLPAPGQSTVTSNRDKLEAGFSLAWNNVFGANGYKIYKGEILLATTLAGQNSVQIIDTVDATETDEKELEYRVQTLGKVDGYNIMLPSINKLEKLLVVNVTVSAKPDELDVSNWQDWNATWQGVASNAYGYCIEIGGATYYDTKESYDLSTLETPGEKSIRVCTRGNGSNVLPSHYTERKSIIKLEAPTELKISTGEDEGKLTWKGDNIFPGVSYEIICKNRGETFPSDTTAYAVDAYVTEAGETITVKAIANRPSADGSTYYLTSNASSALTVKRLDAPTFDPEVKVSNGKLMWKPSGNSGVYTPRYMLYSSANKPLSIELGATEIDISDTKIFPVGVKVSYKVKAIGDGTTYINSSLEGAPVAEFIILETPTIKKTEIGFQWNWVNYSNEYTVLVDGVAVDKADVKNDATNRTSTFTPTQFKELKDYQVQVLSVGDNNNYITSTPAKEIVKTKYLDYVTDFALTYSAERYEPNGTVTVTVNTPVAYATGYEFVVDGVSAVQGEDELAYTYRPNAANKMTVKVYARGGRFDNDGFYRLSTERLNQPSKTITLLSKPSRDTIGPDQYENIQWQYIEGCTGYEVLVTYKDNEGTEHTVKETINSQSTTVVTYSRLIELGVIPSRIVKVQVSALGDVSKNIISSAYGENSWTL